MSQTTVSLRSPTLQVLLAIVVTLLTSGVGYSQSDPIFSAAGFQQNHDYFSAVPGENIDSNTGALILSFTDLVLPGNNGSELRFQRTYNSKDGRWRFGLAGVPIEALFDEIVTAGGLRTRTAWTADGGAHYALYPSPSCPSQDCRYFLTKEFSSIRSRTRSTCPTARSPATTVPVT